MVSNICWFWTLLGEMIQISWYFSDGLKPPAGPFFPNQLSRQSRKVHWRGLCNRKSQFLTLHLIHQYIKCRQTRQTPPAMVGSFKMFVRIPSGISSFPGTAANQLLEVFIAINFVRLHLFLLGDILYGFCNGKSSPSTHQMSAIFCWALTFQAFNEANKFTSHPLVDSMCIL